MHPMLLHEIVDLCRRRLEQGDYPTEPPASVERLENAVLDLAAVAAVPDLRNAKWLDQACADAGACQSLLFKSTPAGQQPPDTPLDLAQKALAYAVFQGGAEDATPAKLRAAIRTLFGSSVDAQLDAMHSITPPPQETP